MSAPLGSFCYLFYLFLVFQVSFCGVRTEDLCLTKVGGFLLPANGQSSLLWGHPPVSFSSDAGYLEMVAGPVGGSVPKTAFPLEIQITATKRPVLLTQHYLFFPLSRVPL